MIFIIGAGISGLSVADNLKKDFAILEKSNHSGGLATQFRSGKYWFDFSGHYFHFSGKEDVRKYVERFSLFKEYKRDSRIFMFGKLIPFPIQYHLSHFPEKTGEKIFEEMKGRYVRDHKSLKESLIGKFGETLYGIFFRPFMTKYYGRDLSEIIPEMDRGSIPVPDLKSVKEGLSGKDFSDRGYNPVFYYPSDNLRTFIGNIEKGLPNKVRYNETVLEVNLRDRKIRTSRGEYVFSKLVNTMPLKNLINILHPKPDWAVDTKILESVSTLVVNLILREKREYFHWVYLPEESSDFYRAGYYPAHPETACYLERSLNEGEGYDVEDVRGDVLSLLKNLNMIISEDDIIHMDIRVIPCSYTIFNKNWKNTVPGLLGKLEDNNIYSIGRYGSWNYSSMSDDIKSGIKTAEFLNGKS